MQRYVLDAYGVDVEVEREAFRWLLTTAQHLGTEAAVIAPAVGSIDSFSRVLGHSHAEYAKKNRVLTIDGVTVRFYTPKTQPFSFDGPVLVPWADTKTVEAAERMDPPAICATGWSEGGLDDWKRAWAPTDPRTGQADGEAVEAPAAVRGAVESLSGPLGNDVLHPMDKRRAVNAFKALYLCGVPIDHVVVRTLAIKLDWQADAADRLAEIARKIGEGRVVQGGDHMTATKAKALVARFEKGDEA